MLTPKELQQARDLQEAAMQDRGVIKIPMGDPVFNQATGEYDQDYAEPIYEGKMSVLMSAAQGSGSSQTGDALVIRKSYVIKIPASVVGVESGMHCEVTASAADPDLLNHTIIIRQVEQSTWLTCRRMTGEV